MTSQGWGEFVIRYEDDAYQHRIPCWVDLDEMRAEFPNGNKDEYWEPSDPPNDIDWNNSVEEVEFLEDTYPAVRDYDTDGYDHMMERYHGNFIIVEVPRT